MKLKRHIWLVLVAFFLCDLHICYSAEFATSTEDVFINAVRKVGLADYYKYCGCSLYVRKRTYDALYYWSIWDFMSSSVLWHLETDAVKRILSSFKSVVEKMHSGNVGLDEFRVSEALLFHVKRGPFSWNWKSVAITPTHIVVSEEDLIGSRKNSSLVRLNDIQGSYFEKGLGCTLRTKSGTSSFTLVPGQPMTESESSLCRLVQEFAHSMKAADSTYEPFIMPGITFMVIMLTIMCIRISTRCRRKNIQRLFDEIYACMDKNNIQRLFDETCADRFQISQIEFIDNPALKNLVGLQLDILERRRNISNGPFNPDPSSDQLSNDKTLAVNYLRSRREAVASTTNPTRASVLPVWHGCSATAADSIAATGFASLAKTDEGYFGHGIYTSCEALYACMYASEYPGHTPPDAEGNWVVVFCLAVVGVVYPLTRCDDDFSNWPPTSPDDCNWLGYPLQTPYDAHFASVRGPKYFATDLDNADFHELVVKEGSQILPVAKIYFRRSGQGGIA